MDDARPAEPSLSPASGRDRRKVFAIGVDALVFLISIYIMWGWITVRDVQTKAREKGLDPDDVIEWLVTPPYFNITFKAGDSEATIKEQAASRVYGRPEFEPFRRFRATLPTFSVTMREHGKDSGNKKLDFEHAEINLFTPFGKASENVLNACFAFAIGYILSTTIVILRALRGDTSTKYLLLRPLAGALSAACLFLLVLSGASIVWSRVSDANALSIGVIAAFGSLYCERFEAILRRSIGHPQ
jgi:hypothetical protein